MLRLPVALSRIAPRRLRGFPPCVSPDCAAIDVSRRRCREGCDIDHNSSADCSTGKVAGRMIGRGQHQNLFLQFQLRESGLPGANSSPSSRITSRDRLGSALVKVHARPFLQRSRRSQEISTRTIEAIGRRKKTPGAASANPPPWISRVTRCPEVTAVRWPADARRRLSRPIANPRTRSRRRQGITPPRHPAARCPRSESP